MSLFEFLMVMVSIILGLGATQVHAQEHLGAHVQQQRFDVGVKLEAAA